jgi:hypothetical protein
VTHAKHCRLNGLSAAKLIMLLVCRLPVMNSLLQLTEQLARAQLLLQEHKAAKRLKGLLVSS